MWSAEALSPASNQKPSAAAGAARQQVGATEPAERRHRQHEQHEREPAEHPHHDLLPHSPAARPAPLTVGADRGPSSRSSHLRVTRSTVRNAPNPHRARGHSGSVRSRTQPGVDGAERREQAGDWAGIVPNRSSGRAESQIWDWRVPRKPNGRIAPRSAAPADGVGRRQRTPASRPENGRGCIRSVFPRHLTAYRWPIKRTTVELSTPTGERIRPVLRPTTMRRDHAHVLRPARPGGRTLTDP